MGSLVHLGAFAIRHVGQVFGFAGAELLADGAKSLVRRFFSADSRRLEQALRSAHERAFEAIEFALARESLWRKCTAVFARADDKDFRAAIKAALDALPPNVLPEGSVEFREACRREFARARRNISAVFEFRVEALESEVGALARFADSQALVKAEQAAMAALAERLPEADYPNLRRFLTLPLAEGSSPIVVMAVQYFFQREVEASAEISRGQIHEAVTTQAEWLRGVDSLLREHADRSKHLLNDVLDVAEQTLDEVKHVREDLGSVRSVLNLIADAVLRPSDRTSIRTDVQRRQVVAAVERFQALPPAVQSIDASMQIEAGRMMAVLGDFEEARNHFEAAAKNSADRSARALAEYNAYRAALEQQKSDEALAALRRAVELDRSFEPFPFSIYEPVAVLGAGGFGTTFKCRHRRIGHYVAVKALSTSELDREIGSVFGEAGTLKSLRHPSIIGVEHADWCQQNPPERPYLCLEYFDGVTLEEYVGRHGPFAHPLADDGRIAPARLRNFLDFAAALADALLAAHGKGVLHRDLKPRNVMLREEAGRLVVKLIDFGLALRLRNQTELTAAIATGNSLIGSSAVGSFHFAAPEQMGDPEMAGVSVGTYSDVYGFAKTCCFALFGTHQPEDEDWEAAPEPLRKSLKGCLRRAPSGNRHPRTQTMNSVVEDLRALHHSLRANPESAADAEPRIVVPATPKVVSPAKPQIAARFPMTTDEARAVQAAAAEALGVPVMETLDLGNGVKLEMILIPAGEFMMGYRKASADLVKVYGDEPTWFEDEQPLHKVRITRPFRMARYPITVAQFGRFVDATTHLTDAERGTVDWGTVWPGGYTVNANHEWEFVDGATWRKPGFDQESNHPAVLISWNDAQAFGKWLTNHLSRGPGSAIRLPNEAEWEYSCRAGSADEFWWGDSPDTTGKLANGEDRSLRTKFPDATIIDRDDGHIFTSPVDVFRANSFGLNDMTGNVWEWCADWYDANYYAARPDPDCDPAGPNSGSFHVLRGGSWTDSPWDFRSSVRNWELPRERKSNVGFRVASGTP